MSTRAVAIAAYECGGRTGWALADEHGATRAGVVAPGSPHGGPLGGLLTAFEALVAAGPAEERVVLYVQDPAFAEVLATLGRAWSWVEVRLLPQGGQLLRVARLAARAVVRPDPAPAPPQRLVAATDGSVGTGVGAVPRLASYAWVTERGDHEHGLAPRTQNKILLAELYAVHRLLRAHGDVPDLTVLVDSRAAIDVLEEMRRRPPTDCPLPAPLTAAPWLARLAERMHASPHRLTWVAGHSGHALNDIADRLAVAARRHGQGMHDDATAARVVAGILEDLRGGTRV